jgi:signal transduction histidine kinase
LKAELKSVHLQLEGERISHEAQLKLQAAEAERERVVADQLRRKEFVRRINHDLKAPVTVLNWTLAKLKREGISSSKATERLDHIGRTADRLFDLLAELVRTYDVDSRAVEGTRTGEPPATDQTHSVWDAREVLAEAVRMQQPFAESKLGTIRLSLPNYPLPTRASQLQLSRVFDNIIRNAFLHNPELTCLEITARQRAHLNQIEFSDNGKGIKASALHHIFDAGFSTAEKNSENCGLGLEIVKTIVESLGGAISVHSTEDIGTTFTVRLPIAEGTIHDSVVLPMSSSGKA